jgi:hypothetical protein
MIYPPSDGTVTGLALHPHPFDAHHLQELQWLCDVGDNVTLKPSPSTPNNIRAGFAIVVGDTATDVRRHLNSVLDRAQVQVRPTMTSAA